jgi:hypothetical protein
MMGTEDVDVYERVGESVGRGVNVFATGTESVAEGRGEGCGWLITAATVNAAAVEALPTSTGGAACGRLQAKIKINETPINKTRRLLGNILASFVASMSIPKSRTIASRIKGWIK